MFGSRSHPDVSPGEAHARAEDQLLLDVREANEWSAGHAPGAVHMPMGNLDAAALPPGMTVLCVCRSGGRSGRAAELLSKAGIAAHNVAGGMNAWAAAGLPVVRDDGGSGTVI